MYGAFYTGAGKAIDAGTNDDNYADNAGTMTLDVYAPVVLTSLTVTDNNNSGAAHTATDPGGSSPSASIDDQADGTESIHISGVTDPNLFAAFASAWYEMDDATGAAVAGGALPAAGADVTLPSANYTVKGGIGNAPAQRTVAALATRRTVALVGDSAVAGAHDTATLNGTNGVATVFVSGTDVHGDSVGVSGTVTATVSSLTPLPAGATLTITTQSFNGQGGIQLTIGAAGFTVAGGPYTLILHIDSDATTQYSNGSIKIVVP